MTDSDFHLLERLRGSFDADISPRMAELRDRLAERAATDGLLDIAYRTVDSPVGPLLLAGTRVGLLRVAYPDEGHERVLANLAERVSPRMMRASSWLDPVARQLDEYFARGRHDFELRLDFALSRGFRRLVLDQLRQIAYGATASYAAVASASGSPRAVRAVGTACATNPLPIVVPCHRVVRSDGSLGNYAGGAERKRALLELEGYQV